MEVSKSGMPVKNTVETHQDLKCEISHSNMKEAQEEELATVRAYKEVAMNRTG